MTRAESSAASIPPVESALLRGNAQGDVIRLRGEHDVATVPALTATLIDAVAATDADLVLDMSEVEFMDASTIGVIVGARDMLASRSRSLTVRSPSVCVQRVLDASGLTSLLHPEPAPHHVPTVLGAAGALGTWVAVAATERAERRDDAVASLARSGDVPVAAAPAADAHRRRAETESAAGSRLQ